MWQQYCKEILGILTISALAILLCIFPSSRTLTFGSEAQVKYLDAWKACAPF